MLAGREFVFARARLLTESIHFSKDMRILSIHNRYKQAGGEDAVFRSETELLLRHGHAVEQMLFDNRSLTTWYAQAFSGVLSVYNPLSARAIQRKIEYFKPDLIHVYNFTPIVSPAVFHVASRNNTAVVLAVQNYRLLCPSATLTFNGRIYEESLKAVFPWDAIKKGVYRNSLLQTAGVASVTALHSMWGTWRKRIDRYVLTTSFAREKFKASQLSIAERKLVVKPNFVESQGKGTADRDEFYLFVGRLAEEKGIRTLLDAVTESNVDLVVIGDGPLRTLVERHALANRKVRYLGFQSSDTVLRYMKRCRALIFPSIWYEGLPITILEAFSAGTVVLASRLGAMAEIIEDQQNGIHFEPGNAHDLAEKLVETSRSPERSARISENAFQTYMERYTPEGNYEQLLDIYHQAIEERRLPRV